MRAYFAILKSRSLVLFQYKAAAIAGLFTQFFWGLLKVFILSAFYANAISPPISYVQAINFVWLAQAFLLLLPWNIDKEIEDQIRKGDVAYELIFPIDLYSYWFSRSLAMRLMPTLWRALPLFLLAYFFFNLSLPISINAAIYFLISLLLSALLSATITTIIIITLFWTITGEGILSLIPHFFLLLSGMIVPLPLFPSWMQPFLSIQPLRGIIDIPSRIYIGLIPESKAFYYLGFQILWILIFIIFGKLLLKKALKKFVIQGG
jgi:ABC-2 type transport system permease protein